MKHSQETKHRKIKQNHNHKGMQKHKYNNHNWEPLTKPPAQQLFPRQQETKATNPFPHALTNGRRRKDPQTQARIPKLEKQS